MAASVVASVALPISNNFSFAPSMDAYGKLSEYGKLGAWSPLSLFALGEQGAWYDPSDLSTMFQDSAGTTPVTADGQPVGKILDKSGRGNHASQATAASRPLLTLNTGNNLYHDGVDDIIGSGAMALTANMDLFILIYRATSGKGVVLASNGISNRYIGYFESGSSSTAIQSFFSSAATIKVNGVLLSGGGGVTSDQLNTALIVNQWNLLEIRNLNMSNETDPGYTNEGIAPFSYPGWLFEGGWAGLILVEAQTESVREEVRTWIGAKVGLSL